jgi:hypothetical protein
MWVSAWNFWILKANETERKAIEEVNFLRHHPDMNNYVGTVISTVLACEDSSLSLSNMSLEEAHRHIFGGSCSWCRRTFERKKAMQERFYESTGH